MKLEDAEDVWLACVMQIPTFAAHSLVSAEHLSPRALAIFNAVMSLHREGWPTIQADMLPNLQLRTIARRLEMIDARSTIRSAETQLVTAWGNNQYYLTLKRAAEVCKEQGREAAQTMLQDESMQIAARSSGIHWQSATDATEAVLAERSASINDRNQGIERRLRSGNATIDPLFGYCRRKRMTVVGGRTNDGKSTLILQIISGLSSFGTGAAYISLEDEVTILGERMIAWTARDSELVSRLDNDELVASDIPKIRAITKLWFEGKPIRLVDVSGDDDSVATPDKVCFAIHDAARRGAKVVAVDYLQAFDVDPSNMRAGFSRIAKRLKNAAKAAGVHFILGSQVGRPGGGDKRVDASKVRPTMHELKESGDIENMADNVILIWRPEKAKPDLDVERAHLFLDKAKSGRPCQIEIGFDRSAHMFVGGVPDR